MSILLRRKVVKANFGRWIFLVDTKSPSVQVLLAIVARISSSWPFDSQLKSDYLAAINTSALTPEEKQSAVQALDQAWFDYQRNQVSCNGGVPKASGFWGGIQWIFGDIGGWGIAVIAFIILYGLWSR